MVAVGLLAAACGDEDEKTGADAVEGVTCESNCERQTAAGCSAVPASALEECKAACAESRQQISDQCQDELAAAHACVATKVRFTCDSRGFAVKDPAPGAACEKEAAACVSCSGNVGICYRLGG
jgi:hypothetical protein